MTIRPTIDRRRSGLLAAAVLCSLALGACGSSSSTSSSSPSSATSAAAAASTSSASVTSSAAAGPKVAGVDLSSLQASAKHLTPQQVAQIKARLPLYLKAQQACVQQVGEDATKVLACLHQHGF